MYVTYELVQLRVKNGIIMPRASLVSTFCLTPREIYLMSEFSVQKLWSPQLITSISKLFFSLVGESLELEMCYNDGEKGGPHVA